MSDSEASQEEFSRQDPPLRRRGIGRRCLRVAVRLVAAFLLLVVGAILWLQMVGAPRILVNHWVNQFVKQGGRAEVERLRISLFQGAIAEGFSYYDSMSRSMPVVEAATIIFDMNWRAWSEGRPVLMGVRVQNGTIRLVPHEFLPDETIVLDSFEGVFSFGDNGTEVSRLRARVFGMWIKGRGMVHLPSADKQRKPMPALGSMLRDRLEENSWLRQFIVQLRHATFDSPPVWDVQFTLDPNHLLDSQFSLVGSGHRTRLREVVLDGWQCRVSSKDQELICETLEVRVGESRLIASFTFDLGTRNVNARVESSLPPEYGLNLGPTQWREALSGAKVFFHGGLDVDIQAGPAPLESLWSDFAGSIRASQLEVKGVRMESVAFDFRGTENLWTLSKGEAWISGSGTPGWIKGDVMYWPKRQTFSGLCTSALDFQELVSVLPSTVERTVRLFQFKGEPPHVRMEFEGHRTDRDALRLQGNFSGTNFVYNGALFDSAELGVVVTEQVIQLEEFNAEMVSGNVQGNVTLDLVDRHVDFNIVSRANPHQVRLVVGSRILTSILLPFEFDGPLFLAAHGSIYGDDPLRSKLHLTLDARRMAYTPWWADEASLTLNWENGTVEISALDVAMYDGSLSGDIAFHLPRPGVKEPLKYDLRLGAKDVEFEDVIRTLAQEEGKPYEGSLGGTIELAGELGSGVGEKLQGGGEIEIFDGRIMEIPLFGGLSVILTNLYSGLGVTTQTDFQADFTVEGVDLHLENVEVEGAVYSLRGDGSYAIDTKELDFDVEFQLLRDGVVGSVVRLITKPVTKLLEFDLGGTLLRPKWRPKTLPEELWGDFWQ